jgi:LPS export ABC transporter protein LptC
MKRVKTVILFLISAMIICPACVAQEKKDAEQEIDGFSLIQYDEGGEKKWKLNGRSAEVKGDTVKINDISALSFGDNEFLKLKAREGDFNKEEQIVHLKENVVIKSTDGTALMTDSLKWNSDSKNVFTEQPVTIKKADFEVSGVGGFCDMENKTAELKKDIKADINSVPGYIRSDSSVSNKTNITCDGPLEINYKKNKASFLNNVVIKDAQGDLLADRIDVYFGKNTRKIKCVVARGNVRIINGENVTYSEKAIYLVDEGRVILPKRPRLVIQNERAE